MDSKQKAKELVDIFLGKIPFADKNVYHDWKKTMLDKAKQCALICVDEIQEHAQMIETPYEGYANAYQFFKEVKKEFSTSCTSEVIRAIISPFFFSEK